MHVFLAASSAKEYDPNYVVVIILHESALIVCVYIWNVPVITHTTTNHECWSRWSRQGDVTSTWWLVCIKGVKNSWIKNLLLFLSWLKRHKGKFILWSANDMTEFDEKNQEQFRNELLKS